MHAPLPERLTYRSPPEQISISEGNSSQLPLEMAARNAYRELDQHLTLQRQDYGGITDGEICFPYGKGMSVRSRPQANEGLWSPGCTIQPTQFTDQLAEKCQGNGMPRLWDGPRDKLDPQKHSYMMMMSIGEGNPSRLAIAPQLVAAREWSYNV